MLGARGVALGAGQVALGAGPSLGPRNGAISHAAAQEDVQAHRREREAVVLDARGDVCEPY